MAVDDPERVSVAIMRVSVPEKAKAKSAGVGQDTYGLAIAK